MGLNYYASSPTVVLAPQQASYFDAIGASPHQQDAPSPNSCPMGRKYPVPPSLNYLAASSNSAAGRKRSIHDVEPDDLPLDCPGAVQEPPKPKPEPIYGPGMTLIYPDEPGLNISAESQTGTWAEEKHDEDQKSTPPPRPIAVSRKSQRLDTSVKSLTGPPQKSKESIIDENGNTIDHLIIALGVGWKNVMTNPELSVVSKAYTRVIENHFPLTDATIMLEGAGLQAYLVRARADGVMKYWLFDDSLRWCQLLSNNLQGAVNNLKAGVMPIVEGPIINSTPRTPPPAEYSPTSAGPVAADVEMDSESFIGLASAPAVLPVDGDVMQM
jgi:hypothetical protein